MVHNGTDLTHVAVTMLTIPHCVHYMVFDTAITAFGDNITNIMGAAGIMMMKNRIHAIANGGVMMMFVKAWLTITDILDLTIHGDAAWILVPVILLIDLNQKGRIDEDDIKTKIVVCTLVKVSGRCARRPR